MDVLILASEECDTAKEIICAPTNVIELFEHKHVFFSIGPLDFNRTVILIFLAMFIVIGALYFGEGGLSRRLPAAAAMTLGVSLIVLH